MLNQGYITLSRIKECKETMHWYLPLPPVGCTEMYTRHTSQLNLVLQGSSGNIVLVYYCGS